MENNDLLPCPFCGGKAEIKQTGKLRMKVKCKSCLMGLEQTVIRNTLEWLELKMIESWNSRVDKKEAISYSRMVEMLNEKANNELIGFKYFIESHPFVPLFKKCEGFKVFDKLNKCWVKYNKKTKKWEEVK